MRALLRAVASRRYVRSGDGRAVEQRGRLARQALKIPEDAERDRQRGFCNRRQIGRDRRNAQHGAARSRRSLAVVLMPGVLLRRVAGIGVMVVDLTMRMWRGRRHSGLMQEARGGIAERQRHARREHAKQIEQGDKPPRPGAHRPRQANEHDDNLGHPVDFAKAPRGATPSTSACPISRQCGLTLGE